MPASLRDIKRRIRSVKNTQQIAKAMEMIAAARLKKYQEKLNYLGKVEEKLKEMVSASMPSEFRHELAGEACQEGKAVLVFSSDRGLCGAYNANIVRTFLEKGISFDRALFVGRKAYRMVHYARVFKGEMELLELDGETEAVKARRLFERLRDQYERESRAVYLVYTYPVSVARLQTRYEVFLPAALPERKEVNFIYEPEPSLLCGALFQRYLEMRLLRIYICSLVSEYAARMLAMQSAGKNARELAEKLTLTFNKLRQAMITKELLEIVGGAEALKKS